MFAAACDSLLAHRIVECAGISRDLLDRFPVTTAAQRIVRIVVKRNVEHRTKIEIESKNPKQSSGNVAVPTDKIDIVLVTQLLRVWRLAPDQSQSRQAPALLQDD